MSTIPTTRPPANWNGDRPLVELRCVWCASDNKRTVLAAIWHRPTDWTGVVLVPACPAHNRARGSRVGREAVTNRALREGLHLANWERPVSEFRADIDDAQAGGRMVVRTIIPATAVFPAETITPDESSTG